MTKLLTRISIPMPPRPDKGHFPLNATGYIVFRIAGDLTVTDRGRVFAPPFVSGHYAKGKPSGDHLAINPGLVVFDFTYMSGGKQVTDRLDLSVP